MWDAFVKITAEYVGPAFAVLFLGFILGLIYTQRRCLQVQVRCQEVREKNKDAVLNKIDEVKAVTAVDIRHHVEACPNARSIADNATRIATMSVKYETEVKNIHHRMGEIRDSSEKVEKKVTEELRSQRKFLDDLATRIINGTKKGG